MAKTFEYTVADPEATLAKAKSDIEAAGGTLTGNASSGKFSGRTPLGPVAGTYSVSGNVVRVTVTQRPAVVSWGKIQAELAGFFS